MQEILRDLAHKHGKTVIAVTHDPAFADRADRRTHIVDGRIVMPARMIFINFIQTPDSY